MSPAEPTRDESVYMAKIVGHAERYEEMVEFVERVAKACYLLSTAHVLIKWRQQRLAEERREGEYFEMLERDAEEEQREAEEEVRVAGIGLAQPPAAAVQPAADDVARAWSTTFPWAGPTPMLIHLTDPNDDEDA
nr:14-3-3-like protein GF14-F [Aegilops tauschii subsp. strangulata]